VAWDHVYEAAKQELNLEIGTAEHTAAVAARVEACGRLAREIYAAGGPKELAAFVMTPPQPQAGTASGGTVHRVTAPDRKAMKKAPLALRRRSGQRQWNGRDDRWRQGRRGLQRAAPARRHGLWLALRRFVGVFLLLIAITDDIEQRRLSPSAGRSQIE
jgi:hypothetical protein